jgi:hypothetical protein
MQKVEGGVVKSKASLGKSETKNKQKAKGAWEHG